MDMDKTVLAMGSVVMATDHIHSPTDKGPKTTRATNNIVETTDNI